MPGPPPKPAHLRQRRNRATSRATLPPESVAKKARVPKLPPRKYRTESGEILSAKWHPRVEAWWRAVWKSPMAAEMVEADRQRLEVIAELHQQFYVAAESGGKITGLASEIRLQETAFGFTPLDRRRLEWEIDRGEQASEKTKKRRAPKADPTKDPRDVLRAVS